MHRPKHAEAVYDCPRRPFEAVQSPHSFYSLLAPPLYFSQRAEMVLLQFNLAI
jgi:hypothetical protein